MEGKPVQICSFNEETKSYELNLELKKILLSDEVKDHPLAVISIVGSLRKGKSFLLNFFLRYLHAEYDQNNSDNWMGSDESPLEGFKWRGGCDRETTGIWVWSKIFTKVLPNGEKFGVMLMDTQGTFDSDTDLAGNVELFSISTMISSVQIYNLFHQIQEDDLQNLQFFTEYCKIGMDQYSDKPFPKLIFLIRDWNNSTDYSLGSEGGNNYLNVKLKINKDQDREISDIRNYIKSCYKDIECILMPYPGKNATRKREFNGELKDIDNEFKEVLKVFVPQLLAPQNIIPKMVNDSKTSAQQFLTHIEEFLKSYKENNRLAPQTIFQATSEVNNLSSMELAFQYYNCEMSQKIIDITEYIEISTVFDIHNNAFKTALNLYNQKAIMGDEELRETYRHELTEKMSKQFILYLISNENKKTKTWEAAYNNIKEELTIANTLNYEKDKLIEKLQSDFNDYKKSNMMFFLLNKIFFFSFSLLTLYLFYKNKSNIFNVFSNFFSFLTFKNNVNMTELN